MSFSNGCWLQKEGIGCFPPAEVYFTKIEDKKVTLCAPTHKINHRGDTLGGANLAIEDHDSYAGSYKSKNVTLSRS